MKILFTKIISSKYIKLLANNNIEACCIDCIKTQNLILKQTDKKIITESKIDSVIISSQNAALSYINNNINQILPQVNILTVGEKSKNILQSQYPFTNIKDFNSAEELCLSIDLNNKSNFLYCKGNISLEFIPNFFKINNLNLKEIVLYKTILLYPIYNNNFDNIVFFSPSGFDSFKLKNKITDENIYAIGKTTEKHIKKYIKKNIIIPETPQLDDLINTIIKNKI